MTEDKERNNAEFNSRTILLILFSLEMFQTHQISLYILFK